VIKWKRSADHHNWRAEQGDLRVMVARNDFYDWCWRLDRLDRSGTITRAQCINFCDGGKTMRDAKQEAMAALVKELGP